MISDFSSIDFHPATLEERVSKCRAMAEEATMLAYGREYETQEAYLRLAKQWREFASDIARAHPDRL